MVYTGSSRSLCQLEKRVHSNGANPKNQALMRLDLPEDATLLNVHTLGLPSGWRDDVAITQRIGMEWISSIASVGLWVPSAIEAGDLNLLLNPSHPQYHSIQLTIERNPFTFDPRLFGVP